MRLTCVDHLKHGVSEAGAATARREGGGKVLGNLTREIIVSICNCQH